MTKKVFIIRHAEADWPEKKQRDFDRVLTQKGKTDAPKMGRLLASNSIFPDAIISSTANRAITTAQLIAKEIHFPLDKIIKRKGIYNADVNDIFKIIESLDNNWNTVFLFGHNPTFSITVNKLCGIYHDSLPPCSVVGVELPIDDWAAVSEGIGTNIYHEQP